MLELTHSPAVALVIVSEKVQKAVKRQDPKLNRSAVPPVARLALGHAAGNDDITQKGISCGAGL